MVGYPKKQRPTLIYLILHIMSTPPPPARVHPCQGRNGYRLSASTVHTRRDTSFRGAREVHNDRESSSTPPPPIRRCSVRTSGLSNSHDSQVTGLVPDQQHVDNTLLWERVAGRLLRPHGFTTARDSCAPRPGAPFRRGCVANGHMTKASNKRLRTLASSMPAWSVQTRRAASRR